MPLIRGSHSFDGQFTQIPNAWVRDSRLSLQARGLLVQLMSHAPGWNITQESLASANNIGRDAMRSILNELMKYGYLDMSEKRQRNADGTLGGYVYTTQEPTQGEPMLAEPTQAEPTHKNKNLKEKQSKEEQVKKNPTLISSDFKPKTLDTDRVTYKHTDIDLALSDFISYWTEQGKKRADWDATWRNNIGKVADWPRYQKKQNSIWDTIEETK